MKCFSNLHHFMSQCTRMSVSRNVLLNLPVTLYPYIYCPFSLSPKHLTLSLWCPHSLSCTSRALLTFDLCYLHLCILSLPQCHCLNNVTILQVRRCLALLPTVSSVLFCSADYYNLGYHFSRPWYYQHRVVLVQQYLMFVDAQLGAEGIKQWNSQGRRINSKVRTLRTQSSFAHKDKKPKWGSIWLDLALG